MEKITKNSFSGGRNTDVNVAEIPPNQYQAAHNVDFVANGNFFSLQQVAGTTKLVDIANDSTIVELASYPCKFSINGVLTYCIVYFTMSSASGTFNIWCFDTQNVVLYALYQETYGAGYYTTDRVIDVVNYPENGVDHIYFADGYNELRQLTCSITTPWTANSLTAYDLALLRRGAGGSISISSVSTGGSLLTGTYQFAYRMCNPAEKKFTKWSSISNPFHVYDSDNSNNQVFAGIGLPSTRKLVVTVTPSPEEIAALATLPYIQLAVIENIASTPATSVSLQQYEVYSGGSSMNISYLSNTRVASISLDSFVIDPAEIVSAKSLRSSNNRLFAGNVQYSNLQFDSSFGSPAVASGSIITATSATIGSTQADSYSSDLFSSKYVGYFRDEVYRFGVIYKDKYGNRSFVAPLDMSAVTDNRISGAPDMKFPARSYNKKYTLFNSNGYTQGLGLNLTIQNHPTWAVEMEVVRVPRKKNILFQSPMIPMMSVTGSGAVKDYPSLFTIGFVNGTNSSYNVYASGTTNDQPMTSGTVMVPKNLFWPEGRDIQKLSNDINPVILKNETLLVRSGTACTYGFTMLFPTPNMYADTTEINGVSNSFVYSGVEQLEVIDAALLKLNYRSHDIDVTNFPIPAGKTSYVLGEDINTNVSGNFYAVNDGDYYFDSNWVAKVAPLSGVALPIKAYQFYDNFGQTAPVAGTAVMDYSSLSTTGFQFGFTPNIQRSAVVALTNGNNYQDPTYTGLPFASGTLNAVGSGGGYIVGSSGAKYQSALDCTYICEQSTYALANNSYCQAIHIGNVKLGLGDNRYGDIKSLLTYQSTGAVYTFSDAEQAALKAGTQVSVNLDVWGGDCFVAPHTFKVCDSTYSVTNQLKMNNTGSTVSFDVMVNRWGGIWFIRPYFSTLVGASIPVAVQNAAQFVTVYLESEYNGGVRDHDIITSVTSSNGVPIINNTSLPTCRIPLGYSYNFNISRSNYQKVFTTSLQFSFRQYSFDSRVAYSNIKIYNSDQSGFDIFDVADYYDLPEQRYGITSLAIAGDKMYAIQEKGIVYLPTAGRQIEETDSSTLAINSGDVIGRPIIVSSERGSQHLRSIVETGNVVYMVDNKNKDVYVLSGAELQPITENNKTIFRQIFATQLAGNQVKGCYDYVRDQLWLIVPNAVQIFNPKVGWVTDLEIQPFSATYQRGLYLSGFNGVTTTSSIFSAYTGTNNVLLNNTVVPRVSFVVNPDEAFSKTFDVFMLDASDKLDHADLQVVYDTSSIPNLINGLNLAVPNVEDNYRIPLGKDSNGYRLRGMRMLVTAYWGSLTSQLKSIYTKYRLSRRTPF